MFPFKVNVLLWPMGTHIVETVSIVEEPAHQERFSYPTLPFRKSQSVLSGAIPSTTSIPHILVYVPISFSAESMIIRLMCGAKVVRFLINKCFCPNVGLFI